MVIAIDVLSAKNFIFFTSFILLDNHTNEVMPFLQLGNRFRDIKYISQSHTAHTYWKKEITPGLSDLKVLKAVWLFS